MESAHKFYQEIAKCLMAYHNCVRANNSEGTHNWADKIDDLTKIYLPSGSGFDSGTKFDWGRSTHNKLVFNTAFHHMDEHGGYDGWTEHDVIITADLAFGFNIKVTGKNRNDIKNYISDCFSGFEYPHTMFKETKNFSD
jgi:hypothetical protein